MGELTSGGQGSPHVGGGSEYHEVDVSTDSNGDGTATLSWDAGFDESSPVAVAQFTSDEGANARAFCTSSGASQTTVTVKNATTTNGTVTVAVVVAGDRKTAR